MSGIAAVRRHPARIAAFALTIAVLAAVMLFALNAGASEEPKHVSHPKIDPAAFQFPTPAARRVDPRIPLYAVSSEEQARRLERWISQRSYLELTEGRGADRYVILVLSENLTFETIEHLNLARMAHGEIPYRVIDAR